MFLVERRRNPVDWRSRLKASAGNKPKLGCRGFAMGTAGRQFEYGGLPPILFSNGSRGGGSFVTGIDAVGCLRSLRAHVALDGVSWCRAARLKSQSANLTACYRIGAVIRSLPRASLRPPRPTPAFPDNHTPMRRRQLDVDGTKMRYADQIAWAGIATLTGLPTTPRRSPMPRAACRLACRSSAAFCRTA